MNDPTNNDNDMVTIQNQLKQIVKLFFEKAYSKDVDLMQDSSLLREWDLFNTRVMNEIKNLYLFVLFISAYCYNSSKIKTNILRFFNVLGKKNIRNLFFCGHTNTHLTNQ